MKIGNWIFYSLAAIVSVLLLAAWYLLGLNHVDEPLDLVVSIIWWVVIALGIVIIFQVEKRRKERIRTVYVADDLLFNSEKGTVSYEEQASLSGEIKRVLNSLDYSFERHEMPNSQAFSFKVRTSRLNGQEWEGDVVDSATRQTRPFANREELMRIIG